MRQGVTSWFVFYLLQVKGVADAGSAALRVSGLELGGLLGSLVAGRLSDMLMISLQGHQWQRGSRESRWLLGTPLALQFVDGICCYSCKYGVVAVGYCIYDWILLVWTSDDDWTVWSRAGSP